MRSAFVAAALVASALAVPFNKLEEKRALVTTTDVDVVTVTDYVTVTLPEGSAPTGGNQKFGFGGFGDHRHHGHHDHDHHRHHPSTTPSTTSNIFPSTKPSTKQPSTNTNTVPTQSVPTSTPSSPSHGGGSPSTGGGSTPTQNPGATPTDYQEIAIYHHNLHRANHSASDVTWDDNLASIAAQIASSCVYAHNTAAGGGGYGQNIAAGVKSDNISAIITDLFYNGEVNWFDGLYGQAQPSMTNFEHWGHFSQIVWKATSTVGCATQDCSGQGLSGVGSDVAPYFTVCNYGGPGNVEGAYGKNIGEPLGQPTAQWNTGL